MTKNKKKTLLLLDGNAIIHRAYHAIPPLSTEDGTEINAVFGFTSTLLTVLEKFHPDYIIATFDLPGKNFRHEMYSDYKATRKETPEDLIPQFDLVKDVVRSLGITIIEKAGFEADDVIGTVAADATKQKIDTVIVTGDKDTLQLVDDSVKVFTMSRGIHDMLLYDRELVKEKMGIDVDQIIDYKGLRGDASDNIPGVKGVGEKTAIMLLGEYHTLENVYDNIENIKGAVRKKLEADKEQAFLSRDLGIIRRDVPIEIISYAETEVQRMTFDNARKMFQKLGFTSLLKRLPDAKKSSDVKGDEQEQKKQYIFLSEDEVASTLEKLQKEEVCIAIDADEKKMYGVALCKNDVFYVAYTEKTRELINFFLQDGGVKKVCFDAKNDMHFLAKNNIRLRGVISDILLQAYVLQRNKKFEFEHLVFDVTGDILEEKKKTPQMELSLRDNSIEREQVCQRAFYMKALYGYFTQKICETIKSQNKKANIQTLLDTIEMPLIEILFNMEQCGILLDQKRFGEIAEHINTNIEKLTENIYEYAGETFNINSTQQLRVILFDKLGIDTSTIKKTKTGFSTASSELNKIRDIHPIVEEIEKYRELFKLKTTYVDVLPTLVHADQRIHTSFNQAVASTGRLSSSDPNLQNIPIRTEEGRTLREGFVAGEGKKLVSADYSQIDLRCVAHVSGDAVLIDAFQKGADIHTFTAASVLGIAQKDVTTKQRSSAKELNFGLIYGMGQFGFARAAGIDNDQAKKFIAAYFEKFAGVKTYMDQTKKDAAQNGYVETLFGRRRYVAGITSKNFQIKSAGERAAINMPIQGLAADIMKLAMIAADKHITKMYHNGEVHAILQIHDEIIFEVDDAVVDIFTHDIRRVMEHVCTLAVPLVVDVAIGNHWGEL
ncbi:MAG: DNA polymerase I [Candidatus Moraniibacteriota bacterium]|nr:MAG: DNA polymerase I [Candidatus Moranbacteria bacterium]